MVTSASAIGAEVPETITVPVTDPRGEGVCNNKAAKRRKSFIGAPP
jgi:hypothetical protein